MEATTELYDPIQRLTRDLKAAARLIGRNEARYLVDIYYQVQDFRIASAAEERSSLEAGEPARLLSWVFGALTTLENDIRRALGEFAAQYRVGEWLQSICGIGPVLSAGFLANLDVPPPATVGHWWRFAGLDPSRPWLGKAKAEETVRKVLPGSHRGDVPMDLLMQIAEAVGWHHVELLAKLDKLGEKKRGAVVQVLAKRPWCAGLKVLCYKAGECFVKVQGNKKDFYGALYRQRRAYEDRKNEAGDYGGQAAAGAERVGKDTVSYKSYSVGRLPDGHMHARARRWVVKLFLSHIHEVMYRDYFSAEPPKPFAMEKGDHRHYIAPPNLGVIEASEGRRLTEMVVT